VSGCCEPAGSGTVLEFGAIGVGSGVGIAEASGVSLGAAVKSGTGGFRGVGCAAAGLGCTEFGRGCAVIAPRCAVLGLDCAVIGLDCAAEPEYKLTVSGSASASAMTAALGARVTSLMRR